MLRKTAALILTMLLVLELRGTAFAISALLPDGIPTTYPLSIDEMITASAKPAPKECFTSYASENGKEGLVCYLVGKVVSIDDIEANGGTVHTFTLQTENGYASINDTYSFMLQTYSESDTAAVVESDSDYSFPEIGEFVKVVGIYYGYSDSLNRPTFHYGTPDFIMSLYHPAEPEKKEEQPRSATVGESNALRKAQSYLNVSAFSYSGLIEQLEYSGFTHNEAVYAADNCGADWFEQAAKKAKNYLKVSGISESRLIEQLQYNGFTYEQAAYGAKQNGF